MARNAGLTVRRAGAFLVLTTVLGGCSSYLPGDGAMTGVAVRPDRETVVPLGGGSVLTVPVGAVTDPGTIVVQETAQESGDAGALPAGLVPSGSAWTISLRGTTLTETLQLSLVVPPVGPGPDAALLGQRRSSGWAHVVDAIWDGTPRRLTAGLGAVGTYGGFRIDTAALALLSQGLLTDVLGDAPADEPECSGDLAANRITVDLPTEGPVLACAGVAESGAPQLLVVDARASVLAVDVPLKWDAERLGVADPVLLAILETVAAVPLRKRDTTEGRVRILVGPGLGLRLTNPPDRKATLRITPDPRATAATAIAFAAAVLDAVTRETSWISGEPDLAATGALVRSALTVDDCAASLTRYTRQPVANPEQIGRLFRDVTKLAVGCLNRTWTASLVREGPTDPLAVTLGWLQSEIDLIFEGPTIGPALDFPLYKVEVTQTAA